MICVDTSGMPLDYIFRYRRALSEELVPKDLPHREAEKNELEYSFNIALNDGMPPHIAIFGGTGVGKTVTVKRVMYDTIEQIKEENKEDEVVIGYVVAEPSEVKTTVAMCQEVADNPEDAPNYYRGLTFSEVKDKFYKLVRGRQAILVIDEIDKLIKSEKHDSFLYHFTRKENVTLVTITNVVTIINSVTDKRILSSWNPRKILFKDYSADQLRDIIYYRAENAMYEEAINEEVISYIATISTRMGCDARYALDLLVAVGDVAVMEGKNQIELEMVERALQKVEDTFIKDCIADLKHPEKALLFTVCMGNGDMTVANAYTYANRLLNNIYATTLKRRRWRDYRNNLELCGYIELDKSGRGRAKGVESYLRVDEEIDKKMIKNVIAKDFIRMLENKDELRTIIKNVFGDGTSIQSKQTSI